MRREIVLLSKAEADVNEAYWWYQEQDSGLGDDFFRCLDAAFSRICNSPLLYPVRFDDFRRILIRRFPYAVYFEHDEKNVFVYYVFHCSQDPQKLLKRLKNP